jgi:signal transduction histidine kinase/CheY-like chemotaxis protein
MVYPKKAIIYAWIIGLVALILNIVTFYNYAVSGKPIFWLGWLIFLAIAFIIRNLSFTVSEKTSIALDTVPQIATIILFSGAPAAVINGTASFFYTLLKPKQKRSKFQTLSIALHNSGMYSIMIQCGAKVYELVDGKFFFQETAIKKIQPEIILPIIILFLTIQAVNSILMMIMIGLSGFDLKNYLKNDRRFAFIVESSAMPVAVLTAIVYSNVSTIESFIFIVSFILVGVIAKRLVEARVNLKKRFDEISTLNDVGHSVSSSLNLDEITDLIYEQCKKFVDVSTFEIATYNELDRTLDFRLIYDEGARIPNYKVNVGEGLAGWIVENKKSVLIKNWETEKSEIKEKAILLGKPSASYIGVPLIYKNRVLGLITVQSYTPNAFNGDQLNIMNTFAYQIAIAIENANLYHELETINRKLIESYNQLQDTTKEIEEYKNQLELKVKQRTAQLEEANLQLQMQSIKIKETDRLKSAFLANMSHELRTPLNSIIGFSKVILSGIDGEVNEKQKFDLNLIHEAGQHLLRLINEILDLSKIESGKMELNKEIIDISPVFDEVIATLKILLKDKPIELRKELEENLPPIFADRIRVKQIILNLGSNAIKFTDSGSITLTANKSSENEIMFTVRDTGIGIKPEDVPKVFEEFRQLDNSTSRRAGGTGLGMTISKRFVEMHNGKIWIESELGKGTTVFFTIPIRPVVKTEQPQPEIKEEIIKPVPKTILVIDDEISVAMLYRRYLEREGYNVVHITTGRDIVNKVKDINPEAITLDIMIPHTDGWEILQQLKADPDTKNIPVIICSILSEKQLGFSLGAADYLVKPIIGDDLIKAIKSLSKDIKQVMVIDDNPNDVELISRILQTCRYTVLTATSGKKGIEIIENNQVDLVILDLMMPEMDGFMVLEKLKSNPNTKDIPIIIITAKDVTAEDRKRLDGRVELLLRKGIFTAEELIQDVEHVIEKFH